MGNEQSKNSAQTSKRTDKPNTVTKSSPKNPSSTAAQTNDATNVTESKPSQTTTVTKSKQKQDDSPWAIGTPTRERRLRKEMKTWNTFKPYDSNDEQASQFAQNTTLIHIEYNTFKSVMKGPPKTPYEGGTYILDIEFPNDYPFKPPRIKFRNPPFCCNVYGNEEFDKKLGTNTFNQEEKFENDQNFGSFSMEELRDRWSPALTITKVLLRTYRFLFYDCGYIKDLDIKLDKDQLNEYRNQLFVKDFNLFLYKASLYNELFASGATAVYFITPQITEQEYESRITVIVTICKQKYSLPDSLIQTCLLEYFGVKRAYCGLSEHYNTDAFQVSKPKIMNETKTDDQDNQTVAPTVIDRFPHIRGSTGCSMQIYVKTLAGIYYPKFNIDPCKIINKKILLLIFKNTKLLLNLCLYQLLSKGEFLSLYILKERATVRT